LSAHGGPVQKNKQLAGLATTPEQGEYCWSTTPVLRQKCENFGWKINYRIYLITEVIPKIQPLGDKNATKMQGKIGARPVTCP
jgi:hypothetical protein